MSNLNRRALHFVLKIGDRAENISYLKSLLKMTVLRHEEFSEGCQATCNGPYDGRWSKTMIGYGSEDDNFVLELTYNYGIESYKHGNDFHSISILSNDLTHLVKEHKTVESMSQAGYKFTITADPTVNVSKIDKVTLFCSDLDKSLQFWNETLEMTVMEKTPNSAELSYGENQAKVKLVKSDNSIDRGTAFGRIAFSCPTQDVKRIEKIVQDAEFKIHTPHVRLETPGKATVEVVILSDPDGHEICFVGDEAFRELSQTDPEADAKLSAALNEDHSNEWFKKHGVAKK